MRSATFSLACLIILGGCESSPPRSPVLTAERARDALLDFIRREPEIFVGNPLPERLAQLPLQPQGDGTFNLGAFNIDPVGKNYSAAIGTQGSAPCFYSGQFELRDNAWIATKPHIQHLHQPLTPPAP